MVRRLAKHGKSSGLPSFITLSMLAILTTSATAFSLGGGAPARGVQRHAAVTSLDFLSKCETSLSCALRLRGGGA